MQQIVRHPFLTDSDCCAMALCSETYQSCLSEKHSKALYAEAKEMVTINIFPLIPTSTGNHIDQSNSNALFSYASVLCLMSNSITLHCTAFHIPLTLKGS